MLRKDKTENAGVSELRVVDKVTERHERPGTSREVAEPKRNAAYRAIEWAVEQNRVRTRWIYCLHVCVYVSPKRWQRSKHPERRCHDHGKQQCCGERLRDSWWRHSASARHYLLSCNSDNACGIVSRCGRLRLRRDCHSRA